MSSADTKPASSAPEATSNLAKSFEDRLSFPSESKAKASAGDLATSSEGGKFNWADEVTTPVQESNKEVGEGAGKSDLTTATAGAAPGAADGESSLSMAQKDGSTAFLNGSQGLDEPEFDVNVKLADLQDDPNNPLYSVTSFAELNL